MSIYKAYLDLFIAISLLIAFGQDIYNLTSTSSVSSSSSSSLSGQNSTLTADLSEFSLIEGTIIRVTDGYRKDIDNLLKTEKYNVKVQSYKFQGADWWFQTAISYGHMILVYLLMGKYKTQTNEQTKKKIMFVGGLIVLLWFFIMPKFKQNRIAIEIKGVKAYQNANFLHNDIVSAIADQADILAFNQDSIGEEF